MSFSIITSFFHRFPGIVNLSGCHAMRFFKTSARFGIAFSEHLALRFYEISTLAKTKIKPSCAVFSFLIRTSMQDSKISEYLIDNIYSKFSHGMNITKLKNLRKLNVEVNYVIG